jgi:hypothetical protein
MTQPSDELPTTSPRRPPAAPARWGTVTPLGTVPRATAPSTAAPTPQVDGSLALDTTTREPAGKAQPGGPGLRLVTDGDCNDEVRLWATRFAQAVVEVLGGDRPLSQLLRWTSRRVYLELDRRLSILNRSSDAGRRMRTVRPQVHSVHVFHPTARCAEVSVHVRHGARSRAIAARLEQRSGHWQCTALQLG